MNSEIDVESRHANQGSRRYIRMGREASPLLPFIPSDINESCNDLFDFDFGNFGDTAAGADEHGSLDVAPNDARGALDEIDMSALDRQLDGAIAGFDVDPRSTPPSLQSSTPNEYRLSVWEDGEKFWEQRPEFAWPSSTPLPVDVTPIKKQSHLTPVGWDCDGSSTPVQRMRDPNTVDTEPPSSITKTPRSLYDSDGFLRP
jgi:hypothetical protein